MRVEPVEIYSDQSNSAVLRHPGRRFPGLLLQGDTLFTICTRLDQICASVRNVADRDTFDDLDDLRQELRLHLDHYKAVLAEHNIPPPFFEAQS